MERKVHAPAGFFISFFAEPKVAKIVNPLYLFYLFLAAKSDAIRAK